MSKSESELRAELSRLEEENRELKEAISARRRFIDSLQGLMDAVDQPPGSPEIIEILDDVLARYLEAINARDGSLLVLDENTGELIFVLVKGEVPKRELLWRRVPRGYGIAGWVVQNSTATVVNNTEWDGRFFDWIDDEFKFKTKSVLAVPIMGGGEVIGVIEALNKVDDEHFTTSDQTRLELLCRLAGEVLYTMIKQIDLSSAAAKAGA
jgi:GAF domain-containing protein